MQAADHSNQPIFGEYRSPSEWPWPLALAVSEARRVISYFEHLSKEQQPPAALWHSAVKCNKWIEEHQPGKGASTGMIELDESDMA